MREVIGPFNARMQTRLTSTVRRLFAECDWVIVLFDASGKPRDRQKYSISHAWFLYMIEGCFVVKS